jgi:hypothetical protein
MDKSLNRAKRMINNESMVQPVGNTIVEKEWTSVVDANFGRQSRIIYRKDSLKSPG